LPCNKGRGGETNTGKKDPGNIVRQTKENILGIDGCDLKWGKVSEVEKLVPHLKGGGVAPGRWKAR